MIGSHHDCPLCTVQTENDCWYMLRSLGTLKWSHKVHIVWGPTYSLHVSELKENPSTISYPPKLCSNRDWIGHLITVRFAYWLLRSNMGFGGTDWWGPIVWKSMYVVTIIRTTQLTCAHHLPCTTPKCRWWDLPVLHLGPTCSLYERTNTPQRGRILDCGFLPIDSVYVESFCEN